MRPLIAFALGLAACSAPAEVRGPAPPPPPPVGRVAPSATEPAPVRAPPPAADVAVRFLKGQTHVHTNRSYDARTPPDQVVKFYRERGYDFLVVTDHNRVTAPPSPDGMLVFAGVELTQNSTVCEPKASPGYRCLFHLSGLFVDPARDAHRDEKFPFPFRPGRLEAYRAQLALARELSGTAVLNHPLFHFAADGRLVKALADDGVRHVELWNASLDQQHPASRESAERRAEALWDEVLTLGARVFGVATDDAHHFADAAERARLGKFAYVGDRAWIMLRADKTPAAIRTAFEAGEFYSSTGVTLSAIEHRAGALALTAVADPGQSYTIRFVGKGGRELARVVGTSARHALEPGGGYLRAVVEDSRGHKAWTQPVWQ